MLTIHGLLGRLPRFVAAAGAPGSEPPIPEGIMVGEAQSQLPVLACPTCGRPLDRSTGRCPGCGSLLAFGVEARRASLFVAAGVVAGIVLGALGMAVLGSRASDHAGTAGQAGSGASATAAPGTGVTPTASAPVAATSALQQSAVINGRLAAALVDLKADIAHSKVDPRAVAQTLRGMAADAAFGVQIAPLVGRWDAGADLSDRLAAFYAAVRATAHAGLDATLSDVGAYRSAATKMIALLRGLAPLDAASRALATSAGIEIDSVDVPAPAATTAP